MRQRAGVREVQLIFIQHDDRTLQRLCRRQPRNFSPHHIYYITKVPRNLKAQDSHHPPSRRTSPTQSPSLTIANGLICTIRSKALEVLVRNSHGLATNNGIVPRFFARTSLSTVHRTPHRQSRACILNNTYTTAIHDINRSYRYRSFLFFE